MLALLGEKGKLPEPWALFYVCFQTRHDEIYATLMYTCHSHRLVGLQVSEMALAMEHLHQEGIVYRDLKLENAM